MSDRCEHGNVEGCCERCWDFDKQADKMARAVASRFLAALDEEAGSLRSRKPSLLRVVLEKVADE